jgi:vacuolar-type H+-ATPase subunit E/Vma4
MATTLEDFVAKLHSDGVATGRAEAERLVADARRQAETIVWDAEAAAREVIARAESQAAAERSRAETELNLAVRDVLLGLRATLTRCMVAVVRRGLAAPLRDPRVLTDLLTVLVREYARADAAGDRHIEIHVPEELVADVSTLLLEELGRSADEAGNGVDVRGGLCGSGFEYRVRGAKVDVTLDAVVAQVRELVRPELWRLLDEAARAPGAGSPGPAEPAAPSHPIGVG